MNNLCCRTPQIVYGLHESDSLIHIHNHPTDIPTDSPTEHVELIQTNPPWIQFQNQIPR